MQGARAALVSSGTTGRLVYIEHCLVLTKRYASYGNSRYSNYIAIIEGSRSTRRCSTRCADDQFTFCDSYE